MRAGFILSLALAAALVACSRTSPRAPVVPGVVGIVSLQGATTVVKKGDTYYAIARAHGVSIRDLIKVNDARPPYRISPGQVLLLPSSRVHVVESGDTLSDIAVCHGADLRSLVRLNGLVSPYLLRLGDRIRLTAVIRPPACAPEREPPPARTAASDPGVPIVPPVPGRKPSPPGQAFASVPAGAAASEPARQTPQAPPRRSGKRFLWPTSGEVTSGFGLKPGGLRNDGINISAAKGSPVWATENGVVVYAGDELPAYGKLVLVRHADGWISAYAHNANLEVSQGDKVDRGQKIALVGDTGNVSGPQVHFELRTSNGPVDPVHHLEQR